LADRIVAACALLLAAAYLYAASKLPSLEIGDPLGPKAFPILLGGLFAMSAVLLLVESLRSHPARAGELPARGRPRAVAITAAGTAAFFSLLEPLGYLVAMSLYLFGLMAWLHRGSLVACATVSVLFTVASYALFAKVLGVTLARGLLSF
jgi:putative tricarboxylic transport membrane protein